MKKYKNISKNIKNIKIEGEFVSVEPDAMIESPVKIHDEEMELIEAFEPVTIEQVGEVEEETFVVNKELPKESFVPVPKKKLESFTKDGLNDYAAKIGLLDINESMKKSEMIDSIMAYQEILVENNA